MTTAITGATGQLGSLVITDLLQRGVVPGEIVAIVRDNAKAAPLADKGVTVRVADYSDRAALESALTGVDKLLLISGSEVGQRVAQHNNVIDAAEAAGVSLIAYTSLLKADSSGVSLAPEHLATEERLAASPIPSVLLRNGWYWENYGSALPQAIESGTLYGAAGNGRLAAASRADFAAAAAAVLTLDDQGGKTYELGGDERLTYAEFAKIVAEVSGEDVAYADLSESDYAAALVGAGLPEPVATMLAGADAGISRGELDTESGDLQSLIGRPSTPVADVIKAAIA
ncbi:MAG: SDR family NAD(P)-dependent oxidoreductase [Gordonia sp.]|uniref:SDR family oxidoreductase n=1 Tax=Williamsia sp. 1138 TaxID=1903117 RepID=UPI000A10BCD0|nr:SDR family oxidoreductase [Williamsia sp. 1138]MBA4023798.1 SDR family NAD(P)-dependent oxidoreductase [Gordonia sp. (in: high G+C Gram-positive bacteria)]OZG25947.1 NAD(P)-dependent oxidoreductase [Williamsia sp. 1138]